MRKTYKKIKLQLDTGKIFIEDVNESNFHPSQVNEIINVPWSDEKTHNLRNRPMKCVVSFRLRTPGQNV